MCKRLPRSCGKAGDAADPIRAPEATADDDGVTVAAVQVPLGLPLPSESFHEGEEPFVNASVNVAVTCGADAAPDRGNEMGKVYGCAS